MPGSPIIKGLSGDNQLDILPLLAVPAGTFNRLPGSQNVVAWRSWPDELFQMSNWTGRPKVRKHGGMAQSVGHFVKIPILSNVDVNEVLASRSHNEQENSSRFPNYLQELYWKVRIWWHGSVGRAHRSHRWGRWFESNCHHQKSLAG